MNNAPRILSKGSTLLRGCWFWSEKLHFQKNFGQNFIAVDGVIKAPQIYQSKKLETGKNWRFWYKTSKYCHCTIYCKHLVTAGEITQ